MTYDTINDTDRILSALTCIDAADRDVWLKMGMAIKSELGEHGFDAWDDWGQTADNYSAADSKTVWRSIRPGGKVGIGSLFHEAKQRGWQDDGRRHTLTPAEIAKRQRAATERAAADAAEIERERAETATKAAAIMKASTAATSETPHLARKQVPPTATLFEIDADAAATILSYTPKSGGEPLEGRLLVAPVTQGDKVSTLELIDGKGRKTALAGRGTKAGGWWSTERLPGNPAVILVGEGVATTLSAATATGHPGIAALSAGNLAAVAQAMRDRYQGAELVLLADLVKSSGLPDPHAVEAARAVDGKLAIPDFGPQRDPGDKDMNDLFVRCGAEAVQKAVASASAPAARENELDVDVDNQRQHGNGAEPQPWVAPLPIPDALLPVEPFDYALLPESMRPWVADIAERMQCPPDFVAAGAMVALSSVIGRKASIAPKRHDDWRVIPNLWGVIVGRPGVMKSPALAEVMKPIGRLAATANERHAELMRDYTIAAQLDELAEKDTKDKAQKLVKAGKYIEAKQLLSESAEQSPQPPPPLRRHKVTDSTVEALGEILIENPWGVLCYRDELHGLLRSLDKEGQEGARAFYLQAYDGNQGYTFDRIMRGRNLHIPAVCVAMLGGIQPGKLQSYIYDAVKGGAGDDGLLQRFGLLVWPDIDPAWRNVDRYPDTDAKNEAFETFKRLDALPGSTDPETGETAPTEYRFAADAQAEFDDWRHGFETALRSGEHHPAMESHLSKYRKLVPALALVCALADGEEVVSLDALLRALAWAEYLQSHAMRAYAAGTRAQTDGARALLGKIKGGKLKDGFTPRDVYNNGWALLTDKGEVQKATDLLCDLGYLRMIQHAPGAAGGRPSFSFEINPAILAGGDSA